MTTGGHFIANSARPTFKMNEFQWEELEFLKAEARRENCC
jgi:hypothetical protein